MSDSTSGVSGAPIQASRDTRLTFTRVRRPPIFCPFFLSVSLRVSLYTFLVSLPLSLLSILLIHQHVPHFLPPALAPSLSQMTARPTDAGQAVLPPPPPLPVEGLSGHAPTTGRGPGPGVGGNASARHPPHASTSRAAQRNPQLGPEPWFAFPIPSDADLEDELPPYFEEENVPLGQMLDRVVRKGYGDMRHLVTEV